jgi:hypothetical protein
MQTYAGVYVEARVFLTSELVVGERLALRPCSFSPGQSARGTHWIDWVGPRAGMDDMEK